MEADLLKELREMMLVQAAKAEKSKEEMFEKFQEQAEKSKEENVEIRKIIQEQTERSKEQIIQKFQEHTDALQKENEALQAQLQAVEEACRGSRKELETHKEEIKENVAEGLQQELAETKIEEIEKGDEIVQKNSKQAADEKSADLVTDIERIVNRAAGKAPRFFTNAVRERRLKGAIFFTKLININEVIKQVSEVNCAWSAFIAFYPLQATPVMNKKQNLDQENESRSRGNLRRRRGIQWPYDRGRKSTANGATSLNH